MNIFNIFLVYLGFCFSYFIKYLLSARPGAMLLEYYIVAMIISKRRLELSNLLQGLGQGENLPAIRQAGLPASRQDSPVRRSVHTINNQIIHYGASKIGIFCHPPKDTRRDNDHAASSRVGYIIILFLDSNFRLISSEFGP